MDNLFSLECKTILVTGASAGIGKAIAIACAQMGATVILNGRDQLRLQSTLKALAGEGHQAIQADLTDAEGRAFLVETCPELDGLVQCAGIGNRVPCKMIEPEDVSRVMQPNLEAPILLQSELLQAKKIRKGASIVYMASSAATMPSVGNALYSASKGAIIAYARCLAQELAPRQIRVNCISPSMVWTNLALVGATEDELKEAEKAYLLHRYGQPEDIAPLAVYLLSGASSWMTGSNLEITGGALTL